MEPKDRIYVAIDTNDVKKALDLVEKLSGKVGGFKLGLEFFTSVLIQLWLDASLQYHFDRLMSTVRANLFWDGKFHDIPNTVGGAAKGLEPLAPRFFNVHASAGTQAIKEAVRNKGGSKVLAVTLLTSFDEKLSYDWFFHQVPRDIVPHWASLAVDAGVDGLVCSPADLEHINRHEKLVHVRKMTPGIRPLWSVKGDQARIMTPKQALEAGATWMVIGRPITECSDGPEKAVERILEEIS